MTPQQFIFHSAAGLILGYAAAAFIRRHVRITIHRPDRAEPGSLEALDFETPCSVGPYKESIFTAFEPCPSPAEWNVEVHACSDDDPDGTRPLVLCSEHLNYLTAVYLEVLNQRGYRMPCGKEVDSVLDVISAERISK